jgi:DNA-binding XRE family transcriptional regulator
VHSNALFCVKRNEYSILESFYAFYCTFLCVFEKDGVVLREKSSIMHVEEVISQLKTRRSSLNVTQEMLADSSGVALRTIKQFESGKGNPTLETLQKLSAALGMEIHLQVKSPLLEP